MADLNPRVSREGKPWVLNAYVVRTKDERSYTEPILDDGSGPHIPYLPIAPVVAKSPGEAKSLFIREFTHRSGSGVYADDWTDLRVRLLRKDVDLEAGVREHDYDLWGRLHEIKDHNGRPCDCPEDLKP